MHQDNISSYLMCHTLVCLLQWFFIAQTNLLSLKKYKEIKKKPIKFCTINIIEFFNKINVQNLLTWRVISSSLICGIDNDIGPGSNLGIFLFSLEKKSISFTILRLPFLSMLASSWKLFLDGKLDGIKFPYTLFRRIIGRFVVVVVSTTLIITPAKLLALFCTGNIPVLSILLRVITRSMQRGEWLEG